MQENSKTPLIAGGIAAVVAIVAGAYLWLREPPVEPTPIEPESVVETPPASYPIPETAPSVPLPELTESDPAMLVALARLFPAQSIEQFLVQQNIVRNVVVSVDNLPRRKVAERLRPVKRIGGQFVVAGSEDARVLSEENYVRYQPFVQVVKATDMNQVAALYFEFYPLFQQAYADLGYPDGYFNNRLVEVIDHLLETPDVAGPIRLTQPGVLYEFADPKLESLSAGQKMLIRVGKANAAVLKTKLRELRAAVSRQSDSLPVDSLPGDSAPAPDAAIEPPTLEPSAR